MASVVRPLGRMVVALTLFLAACTGGGGGQQGAGGVRERVISDPTTRQIQLFRPAGQGSWPVVMAYHGLGGGRQQMSELGRRLAADGLLVFAPDVRTDVTTQQGVVDAANDSECAYRYARRVARDYGGDLSLPVTFVGWSFGANYAVQGGLDEQLDPTRQFITCLSDVPRPDVIVALDGCHYEFGGRPSTLLDPAEWGNRSAHVVLAAGAADTVCPAWQSEKLATELRTRGYSVRYQVLSGADHFAPVFLAAGEGGTVPAPRSPAGDQTVRLITAAVADGER